MESSLTKYQIVKALLFGDVQLVGVSPVPFEYVVLQRLDAWGNPPIFSTTAW